MPNIRVRQAIEKISNELNKVGEHIQLHSGIDAKDARFIDNVASDIAQTAAQIAAIAREVQGNTSGETLVRNVRKSLGFTNP
jgi:hypothetical protein